MNCARRRRVRARSSLVIGVVGQRLARKVCPECRTTYTVPQEILARLKLPVPGATLYRGTGCSHCRQTGHRGRETAAEALTMSDAVRETVLRRASASEIRNAACASGMRSMWEDALAKALDGTISLDEALTVLAPGTA